MPFRKVNFILGPLPSVLGLSAFGGSTALLCGMNSFNLDRAGVTEQGWLFRTKTISSYLLKWDVCGIIRTGRREVLKSLPYPW